MYTASVTLHGVTRTLCGASVEAVKQQIVAHIHRGMYRVVSYIVALTIIGAVTLGIIMMTHTVLTGCAWIFVASITDGLVFRPRTHILLLTEWKYAHIVPSHENIEAGVSC